MTGDGFNCVLCGPGSAGVQRWRSRGWRVVECRSCGLLRTWPPPAPELVRDIYEQAGYHDSRSVGWEDDRAWPIRADGVLAALPVEPTAILDFGAGRGHLIRALRDRGLSVEGVEPAASARAYARDAHGVEISAGIEPSWSVRFDAVVALHSLEHVPDPVRALEAIGEVLRPGGYIFAEVPHAGGTGVHSASRREIVLDLPLHLHHFTPRTLSAVLDRTGYEIEAVRLFNSDAVERLLALRAMLKHRRVEGGSEQPRPRDREPTNRLAAPIWVRRLAPGLRRTLPGDKFQIVARVR